MKKFFKKIPFDYRSLPNVFWNRLFVFIATYIVAPVILRIWTATMRGAIEVEDVNKIKVTAIVFIVLCSIYLLAYIGLLIFVRLVDIQSEDDWSKQVVARRKWTYIFDVLALLISLLVLVILIVNIHILGKI